MRKKILFIYPNYSSFVKTDFEILSSKHDVIKYQFKPVKGLFKTGAEMLKQFVYLLFNFRKFDSVFIWFADYHSFLPVVFSRALNKKSFVVIGGFDVARIPSLKYGVFVSKMRGFCAIFSMNNCTTNLTVSNYVDRKVRWLAKKSATRMIYNCVNISDSDSEEIVKEDLIITVGLINSEKTFLLKGIDTFIEVAKFMPDYKFGIVGIDEKAVKNLLQNIPKNLALIGQTNHKDLVQYYKRAKIYCQFSRSESFGVAIVEAMNFGCIPIVTHVGGMPEIVKSTGEIVQRKIEEIARKTERLIEQKNEFKQLGVNHKFSIRNRKNKILSFDF